MTFLVPPRAPKKTTGIVGRQFTDRRTFLLALAAANLLGLTANGVVPGSPGYLRPTSWMALGLGVVALAATARVRRIGADAWQATAAAVSAAALAVALAGCEQGRGVELYLAWFPWLGIYGGLVLSLPLAVGNATMIVAGLVVGVSAASPGHLGFTVPYVTVAAVSTMAATLLVHRCATWSVGQAGRDPLTSLANRAGLLREADTVLANLQAGGGKAVFIQLDIDRFRNVNAALGHAAGDELLRCIASQLRQVRPEPMFVGRLWSDEFALVMSGVHLGENPVAANEQLHRLARTVLDQIRGPFHVSGVDVEVEASAGIAVAPRDGSTLSALIPCADAALRRAKRDAERVGLWDVRIAGVRPWEIALHAELRAAVRRDELTLHYQLLQSAQSGRVAGVEALLRWNHPERGLLPPGDFVPMAERSDLIIDVTGWVLDEALRQCASWAAAGLHVPVSVNLSARMLVVDGLPGIVFERLARHGLPPDVLTLEITESALVTQPIRAAAMLRELRTHGVRFSLDDFGTGYNSLEILKILPFDEVKIDKGFVSGARGNLPDAAIVKTMLDLGHRLGLRVVGEGVEDQETLTMMTELGCDILQGDVLARPLPPADLKGILDARAGNPDSGSSGGSCCGHTPPGEPATCPTGQAAGDVPDGSVAGSRCAGASEVRLLHSPLPPDESERLAALRSYDILDTDPEPAFDDIAMLAAQLCDSTNGYVSFVDADREWFKTCSGCCDCSEVSRDNGIGTYVVMSHELEEIPDLSKDTRFTHLPGLDLPQLPRFLAATPIITPGGRAIGTVTVADSVSRTLTPGQRRALSGLARHTMVLLQARRQAQAFGQLTDTLQVLGKLWYPHELPRATAALADAARSILDADSSTVVLSDIPGSTVFHAAASSTKAGEEPLVRPGVPYKGWDDTGIGTALRTQAPVFFPDPARSPLFPRQIVEHHRVGSALIVPVPGEGGLLGVVALRWTVPRKQLDECGTRAVTLLCGQAGHTLARLRSAQTQAREFGTDPVTGLASRARFLSTLQGLPVGTVVGLFAVPGEPFGGASEQMFRAFAGHLRAVASPDGHVARWADNRFVLAVPGGGRPAAEGLVARLRAAWRAEKMPPFVVGFADTEPDLPPSAALIDAESSILGALRSGRLGDVA